MGCNRHAGAHESREHGLTSKRTDRRCAEPRTQAAFVSELAAFCSTDRVWLARFPHLDLSIPCPDLEAGLRERGWPVQYSSSVELEARAVPWTYHGAALELSLGQRPTHMGAALE